MIKNEIPAGFATETITPAIPVRLSGFAGTRMATGIHDDLYAHTIVVKQDGKLSALIVLDLLSVDMELTESVKRKADKIGFGCHNIQIMATHTHSGPVGINETGEGPMKGSEYFLGYKISSYIEFVSTQILKSLEQALKNMSIQQLRIGKTKVSAVSSNRSRPADPYDDILLALEFRGPNNEKNIIIRYSCHPTILDASNTLVTADFPSYLYSRFSKDYDNVIFMNGACGDISTRYTRQASDFSEVQRIGGILEEAVLRALEEPCYSGRLNEFMLYNNTFEGIAKNNAPYQRDSNITIPVSAVLIQNIMLVLMPVEISSSLVIDYLSQDQYFNGYANGYYMYLPDVKAYENGEYEADMTLFEKGEGERLIRDIHNWIDSLPLSCTDLI